MSNAPGPTKLGTHISVIRHRAGIASEHPSLKLTTICCTHGTAGYLQRCPDVMSEAAWVKCDMSSENSGTQCKQRQNVERYCLPTDVSPALGLKAFVRQTNKP